MCSKYATNIFKAYYTRIFANLQQKNASGHLTKLWKDDPFKAKWTILARAYSRIRDEVGKARAPLDRFLALACPVMGIIAAEEYLTKMNWCVEVAQDGTLSLHQTSSPFSAGFEHRIMHSSMTDSDVIIWVASYQYIPTDVATHLVYNVAPLQQNVLAAAPVFQRSAPPQPAPQSAPFLQADPVSAASMIFGFDVDDLLNSNPHEWTGSMSDLYNPDAGFIDIESIANNEATDEWNISSIQDPRGFESLFDRAVQDGYSTPFGIFLWPNVKSSTNFDSPR